MNIYVSADILLTEDVLLSIAFLKAVYPEAEYKVVLSKETYEVKLEANDVMIVNSDTCRREGSRVFKVFKIHPILFKLIDVVAEEVDEDLSHIKDLCYGITHKNSCSMNHVRDGRLKIGHIINVLRHTPNYKQKDIDSLIELLVLTMGFYINYPDLVRRVI